VKRKRRRSKLLDRSRAVECADKAMSDYIRARDKYTCVTCGKQGNNKTIDNGHFISRRYWIWRYDERNGHAQCKRPCNKDLGGNWPEYYDFMIKTYGQAVVDELINGKHKLANYTVPDLLEIEQYYKDKLEALNGTQSISD
jgi:hypothetical protein